MISFTLERHWIMDWNKQRRPKNSRELSKDRINERVRICAQSMWDRGCYAYVSARVVRAFRQYITYCTSSQYCIIWPTETMRYYIYILCFILCRWNCRLSEWLSKVHNQIDERVTGEKFLRVSKTFAISNWVSIDPGFAFKNVVTLKPCGFSQVKIIDATALDFKIWVFGEKKLKMKWHLNAASGLN